MEGLTPEMMEYLKLSAPVILTAACGWLLATVRQKESRIKSVEDSVLSIEHKLDLQMAVQGVTLERVKADVKEIKGSVRMLVKNQLRG